mmetsp:Transcript_84333/g.247354  ORF Transcript_84333/g.247354 Transcript_84333/m.247354 type:complete len:204 (+) Transcript_84333:185-796(+)
MAAACVRRSPGDHDPRSARHAIGLLRPPLHGLLLPRVLRELLPQDGQQLLRQHRHGRVRHDGPRRGPVVRRLQRVQGAQRGQARRQQEELLLRPSGAEFHAILRLVAQLLQHHNAQGRHPQGRELEAVHQGEGQDAPRPRADGGHGAREETGLRHRLRDQDGLPAAHSIRPGGQARRQRLGARGGHGQEGAGGEDAEGAEGRH